MVGQKVLTLIKLPLKAARVGAWGVKHSVKNP